LKRVKELLQRESLSSINSCSICGLSPLLYAARKGNVEVIRLLLASGADVNHVTPSLQSSVLHRAALSGKLEAVQMLLERDRKLVIRKDVDGKLPVDKAANEAIRSLLLEAQADLERGIDS
jgi:ankyrin repeat protein